MTPLDLLAPTYTQMLSALSAWLDKAAAQLGAGEADALMSARLAPDMFPLATQVRFACVQALEGMHRLRGEDFPPLVTELLDEGRSAEDVPGTLVDAKTRIAQVIATVEALADPAAARDGGDVEHAPPMGIVFDLTLDQYARDWAIGQFYFHTLAAYMILRHRGVDLGKADYVAHMFAHVRPGTMPG